MSAHPRRRRYRSLEIDIAVLLERAEIRAAQGLGRDANFEGGFVEGHNSKTSAVDADAVAEMAVV